MDYIDIPKRSLLSVPGYDEPVEFGVLTSFAYPLEDDSGEQRVWPAQPSVPCVLCWPVDLLTCTQLP